MYGAQRPSRPWIRSVLPTLSASLIKPSITIWRIAGEQIGRRTRIDKQLHPRSCCWWSSLDSLRSFPLCRICWRSTFLELHGREQHLSQSHPRCKWSLICTLEVLKQERTRPGVCHCLVRDSSKCMSSQSPKGRTPRKTRDPVHLILLQGRCLSWWWKAGCRLLWRGIHQRA